MTGTGQEVVQRVFWEVKCSTHRAFSPQTPGVELSRSPRLLCLIGAQDLSPRPFSTPPHHLHLRAVCNNCNTPWRSSPHRLFGAPCAEGGIRFCVSGDHFLKHKRQRHKAPVSPIRAANFRSSCPALPCASGLRSLTSGFQL